jgi:uncharacterized protein YuzE
VTEFARPTVVYDPAADVAYIQVAVPPERVEAGGVARTIDVLEWLLVDIGHDGGLFGVEIHDASIRMPTVMLGEPNAVLLPLGFVWPVRNPLTT